MGTKQDKSKQIEHVKKEMLDALRLSLGIVTTAINSMGKKLSRTQYYQWLKDDPEFKEQVDDISNIALDFAESKLHSLIKNGDTTATIFYLKTKGKKRGYTEKIEFDGVHRIDVPEWFRHTITPLVEHE